MLDPSDVTAFGGEGEATEPRDVADLLQEFHGGFLPTGPGYPARRADNGLSGAAL